MAKLLRELESSDSDESSDNLGPSTLVDPTKPWLKEFNQYLNAIDELSDGQTIVQWWGVSIFLFNIQLFCDH
jgi:hypothetical protein